MTITERIILICVTASLIFLSLSTLNLVNRYSDLVAINDAQNELLTQITQMVIKHEKDLYGYPIEPQPPIEPDIVGPEHKQL